MSTIKLSKELIEMGRTGNGGYTKKQLKVLGVDWPPAKGWLKAMIGTEIEQEKYDKFVAFSTINRAKASLTDESLVVSKRAKSIADTIKEQQEHDQLLLSEIDNYRP
ncbi:MAG: hypothetical protein P8I03_13140 [Thalassotalea sp.]|nr:hypothetical protein [Thalassotalea sp.]